MSYLIRTKKKLLSAPGPTVWLLLGRVTRQGDRWLSLWQWNEPELGPV